MVNFLKKIAFFCDIVHLHLCQMKIIKTKWCFSYFQISPIGIYTSWQQCASYFNTREAIHRENLIHLPSEPIWTENNPDTSFINYTHFVKILSILTAIGYIPINFHHVLNLKNKHLWNKNVLFLLNIDSNKVPISRSGV